MAMIVMHQASALQISLLTDPSFRRARIAFTIGIYRLVFSEHTDNFRHGVGRYKSRADKRQEYQRIRVGCCPFHRLRC